MKLLFAILVLFSASAQAVDNYDLTGRWGFGLGLGMPSVAGPDLYKSGLLGLDGKVSGGFWARYHITSRLGVELAYNRLSYEFKDSTISMDPTMDVVDISAAYRMFPTDVFHVLLQVGMGYARISDFSPAPNDDEDDFSIKGRVGFEYMATENIMLAAHADYYRINRGSGPSSYLSTWVPGLAFTYYFSGGTPAMLSDSDNDGVTDANDKCAGTPVGTNVNGDGCPLQAHNTDADGDGVLDTNDQCHGTPKGQKVTEYGCAQTDKLEFTLNVQFKPGSAVVDQKFTEDLKRFADFLTQYPDTKAEIEGHTDNTGDEQMNYKISQRRADSVRMYLVKNFKIKKARLTSKGYGPSQPVADNKTDEGRMKNRRVVAHVQILTSTGK